MGLVQNLSGREKGNRGFRISRNMNEKGTVCSVPNSCGTHSSAFQSGLRASAPFELFFVDIVFGQ